MGSIPPPYSDYSGRLCLGRWGASAEGLLGCCKMRSLWDPCEITTFLAGTFVPKRAGVRVQDLGFRGVGAERTLLGRT